jgi:transcriptional regulator with XRE-family HTH domain
MSIRNIVGSNIRGFRKLLKLSQEDFAKIAALNRSHLAATERGEINLTLDTLERIATIIGIPVHVLLMENSHKWAETRKLN